MKFGEEASRDAEGALLAHAVRGPGFSFKKGRRLSAADVAHLLAAGIDEVVVARLSADDVDEDAAAAAVAGALAGAGLRVATAITGRSNLYAEAPGIAVIDAARIAAVNAGNEAITIATLPPHARVDAGQMVATVKIIPFAVTQTILETVIACLAADTAPAIAVAPFRPRQAMLILTETPEMDAKLHARTRAVMAARLADLGSRLASDLVVPHRARDLAAALAVAATRRPAADVILVVGASAIVDRGDVIPAAIIAAGGRIERFGMPVEPGNLLLLGRLGTASVIGLPGCARSPKLNGFDWVLERLCAGLMVDAPAIAAMGVGGLIIESGERRPRDTDRHRPRSAGVISPGDRIPVVAAIVLAAGRGERFGAAPKLAASYHGEPLLRHPVRAALAAGVHPVIVVLGHEAARLRPLIGDLPVDVVENSDFASGMASSLVCGLAAVPPEADAVLVLLADMPKVTASHLRRLIDAFNPAAGRTICVPTYDGRRGNPVLWGRTVFNDLRAVTGDRGGRDLLDRFAEYVCEVAMADDGVLFDVDVPQALADAAHGG